MKSKFEFVKSVLLYLIIFIVLWFWGFSVMRNIAIQRIEIENEAQDSKSVLSSNFVIEDSIVSYQLQNPVSMFNIETETPEPIFIVKSAIQLTDEDRWAVECMVAGESKGESLKGKMLVAQCIYNAMLKEELSASEVRIKYQYAGWDENLKSVNEKAYNEVAEAVSRVFDNGEMVVENEILYFYAPALCESKWHESLNHVVTEGCHKFFSVEN